jgi:hypothetical protein
VPFRQNGETGNRDRETAEQVRQVILKEVKAAQGTTNHV